MVPWVGLQYMLVVFSDHNHLLFEDCFNCLKTSYQKPSLSQFENSLVQKDNGKK